MSDPKPQLVPDERPRGLAGVTYRNEPPYDSEIAEYLRRTHAEQAQKIASRGSRMAPFFAQKRFDTFKRTIGNNDAYLAALAVAEDPLAHGIGIYGPIGTGKTHLASAIVNAAIENGHAGVCVNMVQFGIELRQTYDNAKGEATESQVLRKYVDAPILVLDDLQMLALKAWSAEMLYVLINSRYEAKRSLIVTANVSLEDLQKRRLASDVMHAWNATIDRIAEMTSHNWHKIEGSSKR